MVFLFAYLNLNRWHGHFSYGALVWIAGLILISGVAVLDPAVASGVARLSFASTAVVGIGLIVYLGIQGYDRAIMLVPSWVMVLVWLVGSWMTITGTLDNDIVQPALGGGLILIILLIGFTVMQHAFAGGALTQGLFSDMERQALAVTGSGDTVWDWDVARDRVVTRPDVSLQLGLTPQTLTGPARNWLPVLHTDDRDTFRTTLDVVLEHRRGRDLAELPAARRRRPLPLVLAARAAGDRLRRRGDPLRRHAGRHHRPEEGRGAAAARRRARQSDRAAQPRTVHEPAGGHDRARQGRGEVQADRVRRRHRPLQAGQ